MEFFGCLDVADLPASLKRWDSSALCDDGLLKIPSFDDVQQAWKTKQAVFSLEDDDESSSVLSLGPSHSNASSTLNARADLGLNFDFEIFDDLSAQTRTPAGSVPGSPSLTAIPAPTGLPLGKLNLKLDHGAVAASWNAIAGDAPVFAMSAGDVVTAAVGIPSAAAVAASLSPNNQDGWAESGLEEVLPVAPAPKPAPRPVAPRPPAVPRPSAPRPPRKSSSKRRGGSKTSDKRPRIKGRFVTREELERYMVEKETGVAAVADAEDAEMALVPDTDLAFFDREAAMVW